MRFDQRSYPTLGLVNTKMSNCVFTYDIFYRFTYFMLCIVFTQSVVTTISAHENPVACATFNHHGNLLATASDKVSSIYTARRTCIDIY